MTDAITDEMTEAAARAMCGADGADWNAADFNETADGSDPEDQREYWLDKARAAIAAVAPLIRAQERAKLLASINQSGEAELAQARAQERERCAAALNEVGEALDKRTYHSSDAIHVHNGEIRGLAKAMAAIRALAQPVSEPGERETESSGPYTCKSCCAGTWNDDDLCDRCAQSEPGEKA